MRKGEGEGGWEGGGGGGDGTNKMATGWMEKDEARGCSWKHVRRRREGGREGGGMLRVGDKDVEENGGEPRRSPAMHVNVTPLHVTACMVRSHQLAACERWGRQDKSPQMMKY